MPMTSTSISIPAGFAPAYAMGFSDIGGQFALVSDTAPLPVATSAPAPSPLSGQSAASGIVGPFNPTAGRVIVVTLDGEWDGSVRLLRSTDGGLTMVPLRVGGEAWGEYTAPAANKPGARARMA
jgi:hypothetical protein